MSQAESGASEESRTVSSDLPMPPREMRVLVGPTDEGAFDNPTGEPLFGGLPETAWDSVLDFGCGCGRLARRMALQRPRPRAYVGVDLHAGMVRWCQRELATRLEGFEFHHADVRNVGMNPQGSCAQAPLPVPDASVSLFVAWSVFTHLTEGPAEFYLRELARVLRADGIAFTTWFLFDKRDFPMMQEFQNALFINDVDPTNAVIFSRTWLAQQIESLGLRLAEVVPPGVRGFQWILRIERARAGARSEPIPEDLAPVGSMPPPLLPENASGIGLGAHDEPPKGAVRAERDGE